ncbi:hypothetical protein [Roseibium salinum]|uniref:Uncharacterized protein n=1 Tax=Roseibium salinum TaxID=1604349 RepID=A0ABT3R790_9HYPH|nr:hypothetical protein [Roseibium sp. DSM 29163]MCX2724897.1 hypothetical protein [Roseibium sp. DSM 29163]MDN3721161.1 hypothetical protein [Roseibium salinum]
MAGPEFATCNKNLILRSRDSGVSKDGPLALEYAAHASRRT